VSKFNCRPIRQPCMQSLITGIEGLANIKSAVVSPIIISVIIIVGHAGLQSQPGTIPCDCQARLRHSEPATLIAMPACVML